MKLLKQIEFTLLIIATMSLISNADSAPIKGAQSTSVLEANALSPVGDAITFDNIKDFSILIPAQATAQEKYSAAMLTNYLGKMFKVKLSVVQEPQVVKGKIISVGNTKAAVAAKIKADPREQAYKLAASGGNLYILGGTRGPIYGVIALLEEDLGCRWYATDADPIIPIRSKNALTVIPRSYSPPFKIRDILYKDIFYNTKWQAFNRLQPLGRAAKLTQENGGGLASYAIVGHNYAKLVPAKKYFPDHPEYFPVRNGERYPSTKGDGQLCYTSAGVVDVMVKAIEAEIVKNPEVRIYPVNANDNVNDNCECSSCQEIIKSDGVAGAQLNLANVVAARLAVKKPDIQIYYFAYNSSQIPPKNIEVGPNTTVYYAPIRYRNNKIHKLLPIGDIQNIKDELAEWHKKTPRIFFYDYVDYIHGAPVPFPNFDAQDRGFSFLIKNGVTGIHMQGCIHGHGSLGELKGWVYAKKFWNPKWPMTELINEFIASYYGPAAVEMAEYVTLQRRAWANFYRNRKPGIGLKFSPAEIKQMYKLLNTAMEKSRGRSDYTLRIERELLCLLCLSLSKNPSKDTAASYAKKLKKAEKLIIKHKRGRFGESRDTGGYTTAKGLLIKWHKKLKKATGVDKLPQYSKNSITLKDAVCRYVPGENMRPKPTPDAKATLGHAIRQPGGHKNWCINWNYSEFIEFLVSGKVYIIRMRVKQEFKQVDPPDDGILFYFGAYSPGDPGSIFNSRRFTLDISANKKDKYYWIEMGKIQVDNPEVTGHFYSFPGKDLTKDDAVWYDYLEFVPEDEFKDSELAAKLPLVNI